MKPSPRILIGLLVALAVIASLALLFTSRPTASETAARPDVTPGTTSASAPASPGAAAPVAKATSPVAPVAPADAAWNTAATPQGFAAAASADPAPSAGKPGDALPAHLNKLWPCGTFISQTDRATPLGIERVSVIQPGPGGLPYPIRIQEYYPKNGAPVLVSEVIADRVLVGKPASISHEKFARALEGVGAARIKRLTQGGVYQVIFETATPETVPAGVRMLRERFPVTYAEADPVQRASITPTDPKYLDGSLWGLHNTGQNSGVADADIDAPEGWDVRTSAENIVVGVIDSGVLYTHEDIAANMWMNPGEIASNGIDDDANGYIDDIHGFNSITDSGDPKDDHGHGSHCAGTIAGVGNNGLGVAGVAWRAKIMGLKFLSSEGSGALSDAIECVEYARLKGANLTSNSWGGGAPSDAMKSAISDAVAAGQLFVVAAGNESGNNDSSPVYPTSYPVRGVVSVAATDRIDGLAYFSNYGQGTVHIGAPGVDITSLGITSNSAYATMSGTSMSCPHVAGAVAMLMAQFPTDTPEQILNRLYRSADPISSLTDKTLTGARLNLRQALATTSNAPFNDDFAQARAISGTEFLIQTTLGGATAETSNVTDGIANGPATWYRISLPVAGPVVISTAGSGFDTLLGVYTGSSISGLTAIAANDDSGGTTSSLSFEATANTDYYIAVAGKSGGQGYLQITMSGPIVNDDLANATDLSVMGGDGYSGHNLTATKEPGEANHAGNAGGKSLWAKFTAPVTGYYTATSGGEASPEMTSSFDTVLAVYAGPATNPTHAQLIPVASNDNDPCGYFTTSLLGFHATAGQTYYIALDGRNGAGGDVRFMLFPIGDHDYFAHAMPLNGDNHTINTNNRIATAETGEPAPGAFPPRHTLWFDFVPETSGSFEVDTVVTTGSKTSHNTYLAVYTGSSLDTLTQVAADTLESGPDFDSLLTFSATAGQHYKIVTGFPTNLATPLLGPAGLRIRKVEPVLNDNFADAATVPNPAGASFSTLTGKNRGATVETGEPLTAVDFGNPSQNTVWWKWTADRTTKMQVNTIGSSFDTVLWVYTGNSVNALTEIAFDDETGGSYTSLATFTPVIGTTYYFRVAGWDNASGNVVLSLGEHFIPGDNFADAFEIEPDRYFQIHENGAATRQSGEPLHAGLATQSRSLWFKFTATAETAGPVVFSTQGSQDTVVGVYTGSAVNALTAVTSNNDTSGRLQAEASWTAVAGTTYHIAVALAFEGGTPTPYCVTFQPVRYNAFASALALNGDTQSVTAHNFGASKETGEPSHAANSGGRSVWFAWTPATTGTYRVSTIGSNMRILDSGPRMMNLDTLLGIYTGSAVNALTAVASNNDYGYPQRGTYDRRGIASEVYFTATAGTTYRIAVDGHNGSGMTGGDWGQIKLDIQPSARPANDSFAEAEVIPATGLPFVLDVDLDNYGATTEAGEPTHAGNAARSKGTLWFTFTAPETRTYFASTAGNLYDDNRARNTVVAVYTGSAVGSLTPIASNTDGLGLGHSQAQFDATAGTTYHIAIGAEHAGPLSFLLVPAPANNDFANAAQAWGSNFSAVGYNVGATAEAGEADPYAGSYFDRTGTRRSVWWKWTAPVSGTYAIDTYNSDLWVELSIHSATGGPSAAPLWVETGVVSDPLNYTVTGNRDLEDRRARGTMNTSFTFVGGVTYYFRVAGGGGTNDHAGTIRLDVSGPPAIPPAPLEFSGTRSGGVLLSWRDLSNDETGYVIERSSDGSNWVGLVSLNANTVNFLDASAPAADLHYRIKATNTLGSSAWATTLVTLPVPPGAPASLAANALSESSIQLAWQDQSQNETGFVVQHSTTGGAGSFVTLTTLPENTQSYTHTGLSAGSTHYYRLYSYNAIGNSAVLGPVAAATDTYATIISNHLTGWYRGRTTSTPASSLTVSGSDLVHFTGGTTGNAQYAQLWRYFTALTLADGESLRLDATFAWDTSTTIPNDASGLRFGFFSSNGTKQLADIGGDNNGNHYDDFGYGVMLGSGNTTTSRYTEDAPTETTKAAMRDGWVVLGDASGSAAIGGTGNHTLRLELKREGSSLRITAIVDGNLLDGGRLVASPTTFTYDMFQITNRFANVTWRIRSLSVQKLLSTPALTPVELWRQTHFGTTANTGNASDTFDGDGDGLPNLVEYALGGNPTQSGAGILPAIGTSGDRLTLGFTPAETAGLRYIVEKSSDLSDWSDALDITASLAPGQPFTFTDSANLATTPRRFLRLRVIVE